MPDTPADADGECVLSVFGDGGGTIGMWDRIHQWAPAAIALGSLVLGIINALRTARLSHAETLTRFITDVNAVRLSAEKVITTTMRYKIDASALARRMSNLGIDIGAVAEIEKLATVHDQQFSHMQNVNNQIDTLLTRIAREKLSTRELGEMRNKISMVSADIERSDKEVEKSHIYLRAFSDRLAENPPKP